MILRAKFHVEILGVLKMAIFMLLGTGDKGIQECVMA